MSKRVVDDIDATDASRVAFCNVEHISKHGIYETICRIMELVPCDSLLTAKSIFIKVNLLSQEVVPGQCTSPWVFESILKYLNENTQAKIYYGDCNVASASQVEKAVINWGLKEAGDKYNAAFLNLTKLKQKHAYIGPALGNMMIPELLMDMDAILTVPVVKTHCITPFTGALKNQWGLLPRARFQFHDVVNEAIAEINKFFNHIKFGIADITVAMEGPGPRVGISKVCNMLMGSDDLVALDASIARFIGMDPSTVKFLKTSEQMGVGKMKYIIVGDSFKTNRFNPGIGKEYLIYRWRDRLKKIPLLRSIIFTVPMYRLLGYFATKYNLWVWFNKTGKKQACDICEKSPYGKEFEKLIAS